MYSRTPNSASAIQRPDRYMYPQFVSNNTNIARNLFAIIRKDCSLYIPLWSRKPTDISDFWIVTVSVTMECEHSICSGPPKKVTWMHWHWWGKMWRRWRLRESMLRWVVSPFSSSWSTWNWRQRRESDNTFVWFPWRVYGGRLFNECMMTGLRARDSELSPETRMTRMKLSLSLKACPH